MPPFCVAGKARRYNCVRVEELPGIPMFTAHSCAIIVGFRSQARPPQRPALAISF